MREQGAFRVHGHSQMWLMPLTGGAVASYWLSKQILFNVYNIQKTKKKREHTEDKKGGIAESMTPWQNCLLADVL